MKRDKAENSVLRVALAAMLSVTLSGCVTSRIEDAREAGTGINEGEGVVIMAKSYHLGNETESSFIECVGDSIGSGSTGLRVIPHREFVDALFPWFEPRTAPADTKGLPALMSPRKYGIRASATSYGLMATLTGWPAAAACPALRARAEAAVLGSPGGRTTPSMRPRYGICPDSKTPAPSVPILAARHSCRRSSYPSP